MENETEKFWKYLLNKKNRYLEKKEIKTIYIEFLKLWKQKKDSFEKVFDNLRKNKLLFLIDKKWSILGDEEQQPIIQDNARRNHIVFQNVFNYFKQENIVAYFGLSSAGYFEGDFWQTPHTFYLINNKYNLKKKIGNQTIIFIKFPEGTFIENAILKKDLIDSYPFSNSEKTLLDKIYYNEYLKGKINLLVPDNLNFENINLYLGFYKKYPFVKAKLICLLDEDQLKQIT